ncbi:MAG TPA: CHASE domain-containing protein, partial [Rectinemataceae bacterium]|nr:CHASE domain-containing protein [Rectinemataceae bacterium]
MRLHDALESHTGLEKGYIQVLSESILRSSPFIVGVSTAPSAIVKYHFPESGNEALIGHDLLSNPERRDALTRAAELKGPIVSGPFEAVDGGNFLFVRYPVFSDKALWGFVSLTIDFSKMLTAFSLESHYPGIRFALSETSGPASGDEAGQARGSRFLGGNAAAYDKGGVSRSVSLPGAEWRVHVMPSRNWTLVDPYLYILFGAGLTASAVLFFVFYSRARRRKALPGDKESWLETSVKAAKDRVAVPPPIKPESRPVAVAASDTISGKTVHAPAEIKSGSPIPETSVNVKEGSGSQANSAEEPPKKFDQEPAMDS